MLSRFIAFSLAALISGFAFSQDAAAVLDLKFVRDTGEPAGFLCFEEESCDVWSTYYLFEAQVDEIISGELSTDRFLVLYGQHALRKKNCRNVIARLEEIETKHDTGAQYEIVQWGQELRLLCFDALDGESSEVEVNMPGQSSLNCFERDE